MLFGIAAEVTEARGRLAQLSIDALRYGQSLELDDVRALALRLYTYNRLPLTSAWARRLPTRGATERYLSSRGGRSGGVPGPGWVALHQPGDDNWLAWGSTTWVGWGDEALAYKLYVSPMPSVVPEALAISAEVLHELRTPTFKVGGDVHGLLRPDKLVAYFAGFDHLAEAADRLSARLAGLPAHGVPFTAEVSSDGLLSWGLDPPRHDQTLTWSGQSWRLWVVGRLAAALLTARSAGPAHEPWRYALDRIRLDGVDPSTWVPSSPLFAGAHAAR